MTDTQILERMGLSENELQDLQQKLNNFVNSLNAAQRRIFLHAQKSVHEGAKELDHDVTSERLETFLKKNAPPDGIICIGCDFKRHPPTREK